MKTSIIELSKIIFCQESKKYQIIFRQSNKDNFFIVYFSNKYAKNIAMASENISSSSLSQYDLFIDLLDHVNLNIEKILIKKYKNTLTSFIYLNDIENNKIKINSHIADSIILSIKTFSKIYLDENLLVHKENINTNFLKDIKTNSVFLNDNKYFDNISNVEILKNALKKCIKDEKFETAAFLRDRINFLNTK